MKTWVLRQDEQHSHNPVCLLRFVSKLSTSNSTENPHAYFCKDNQILILHTITAQQPRVIICIFMREPQREHGENWSQLWIQTHGMHSPAVPQNLAQALRWQWKLHAEPRSEPLLFPTQHPPPQQPEDFRVSDSKYCLCYPDCRFSTKEAPNWTPNPNPHLVIWIWFYPNP